LGGQSGRAKSSTPSGQFISEAEMLPQIQGKKNLMDHSRAAVGLPLADVAFDQKKGSWKSLKSASVPSILLPKGEPPQ
jgi:hypothetical protein